MREYEARSGGAHLTGTEQLILAFERSWWKYTGAKDEVIRASFAMSPTHYYRTLNALLDRPAALEHDPMLVRRLRRVRDSRRRDAPSRRLGTDPR